MIVLNYVDLPSNVWENYRRSYPDVQLLQARNPRELEDLPADPEVIFGNVPVDWSLRTASRSQVRWLQSVSAGTENYEPLIDAGVRLSGMRGVHHQAMAQHVLTMMLALTRAIPLHFRAQFTHQWKRCPDAIVSLEGSRIGIVGLEV